MQRLDPLALSDRADLVAVWLDDHGVPESDDAAGTLRGAGLDVGWRESMAQQVPLEALPRIVVSQHHGDITARSTPGATVFTVRLPMTGPDDRRSDVTVGARDTSSER